MWDLDLVDCLVWHRSAWQQAAPRHALPAIGSYLALWAFRCRPCQAVPGARLAWQGRAVAELRAEGGATLLL